MIERVRGYRKNYSNFSKNVTKMKINRVCVPYFTPRIPSSRLRMCAVNWKLITRSFLVTRPQRRKRKKITLTLLRPRLEWQYRSCTWTNLFAKQYRRRFLFERPRGAIQTINGSFRKNNASMVKKKRCRAEGAKSFLLRTFRRELIHTRLWQYHVRLLWYRMTALKLKYLMRAGLMRKNFYTWITPEKTTNNFDNLHQEQIGVAIILEPRSLVPLKAVILSRYHTLCPSTVNRSHHHDARQRELVLFVHFGSGIGVRIFIVTLLEFVFQLTCIGRLLACRGLEWARRELYGWKIDAGQRRWQITLGEWNSVYVIRVILLALIKERRVPTRGK